MYTFEELLQNNLPVCVKIQEGDSVSIRWSKQIALFVLTTISCLSGLMLVSYATYKWGLHNLLPLGLEINGFIMTFISMIFGISLVSLILWLQEEHEVEELNETDNRQTLDYILPQSHSLHINEQAWDLTLAESIIIDYPFKVIVHFRNPDKTFVLTDDGSGYPMQIKNNRERRKLKRNGALFVYLTGVDLLNRYTFATNWVWNMIGGIMFIISCILPFFFQAIGYELYWVGFLAIPFSYLTLKVGQYEYQKHRLFTYAEFVIEHEGKFDEKIFRKPL